MYFLVILRAAAVLLTLDAALVPALADDADTCRRASGDDSIAACSRLLARNPKDAGVYYSRGYAYEWRKGDHDHAIADFDQAIVLNPKYALAYADRGFSYEHKGDWDHAFADFEQAILFDPKLPGAYNGRANVYKQRGEYDHAIADYDQALRLNSNFVVVYNNRGGAYLSKGEYDRAIADYDQAIQLNPRFAMAYIGRGNAYDRKEEYDLAIADFDLALRLDPTFAPAYAGRCGVWNSKGQYDRAIAECEDGLKLNPKLANAYSHRGFAYGMKGNFDLAMTDLDKAIALNPRYARGYSNRGAIYERRGDLNQAIADYDEALELVPALPEARRNRERAQAALAARPAPAKPDLAKPVAVAPDRRVALVIGNSQYRSVAFLPNPRRDASAVADALRQVGFQVELAMDLDRDGMVKALRSFRDQADQADWALVFFAGHGIEIDRVNYLIPTDARLLDDRDVKTETVSYEELLSTVNGARALRLVVLDACRNNPFKDQMRRTAASRGATDRGLAPPPESKPGTLVVYSAKEGEVAADDAGGANSPFASALIAELKVRGLEVRRVFDNVRDDVLEATDNRQQPFTYGSLPGRRDFFFVTAK
jgi:tetratricopeptide (TPR) repeat protein